MDNDYEKITVTESKYCPYCEGIIPADAVVCIHCGRQVEELKYSNPQIIINNNNENYFVPMGIPRNKWVAFVLCFLFGIFGAHKFYEGSSGKGVLYLCTLGLFGIGWIIDLIAILAKPTIYYV